MDFTEFRFDRTASESEVETRKKVTLESLRASEEVSEMKDPSKLPSDLLFYLNLIAKTPGLPATKRDDSGGISRKRGWRYRARLLGLDLIEKYTANPGGRGRSFSDVRLTEKGRLLL